MSMTSLSSLPSPSLQDEAFMLWQTHWASLYPPSSPSHAIISQIQDTYYLVNLVDNEYVEGNVLFEVIGRSCDCHVMIGTNHVISHPLSLSLPLHLPFPPLPPSTSSWSIQS